MYTVFGDAFEKGGNKTPSIPEDFEFARMLFGIIEQVLAEGMIKPHPGKVGPNGLEGALHGLLDMKNDKVTGQKLVYRVEETPSQLKAEIEL